MANGRERLHFSSILKMLEENFSTSSQSLLEAALSSDDPLIFQRFKNRFLGRLPHINNLFHKLGQQNCQKYLRVKDDYQVLNKIINLVYNKILNPGTFTNRELLIFEFFVEEMKKLNPDDLSQILSSELNVRTMITGGDNVGSAASIDPRLFQSSCDSDKILSLITILRKMSKDTSHNEEYEAQAKNIFFTIKKYYQLAIDSGLARAKFRYAMFINLLGKSNVVSSHYPGFILMGDEEYYKLILEAAEAKDSDALVHLAEAYAGTIESHSIEFNTVKSPDKRLINRLNVEALSSSQRVSKATHYLLQALNEGSRAALSDLMVIHTLRSVDAKELMQAGMAIDQYYYGNNALSCLEFCLEMQLSSLDKKNPGVMYYSFNYHVTHDPTITSRDKISKIRSHFQELAKSNVENDLIVFTDFDKLLQEQPWGEYDLTPEQNLLKIGKHNTNEMTISTSEVKPGIFFLIDTLTKLEREAIHHRKLYQVALKQLTLSLAVCNLNLPSKLVEHIFDYYYDSYFSLTENEKIIKIKKMLPISLTADQRRLCLFTSQKQSISQSSDTTFVEQAVISDSLEKSYQTYKP